jgi:atypical dual specificity phosphatase
MALYQKILFYPSLAYGIALEYVGLRKWYTRIDDHCILGALPLRSNYETIIKTENVKAILTLNQEHELA